MSGGLVDSVKGALGMGGDDSPDSYIGHVKHVYRDGDHARFVGTDGDVAMTFGETDDATAQRIRDLLDGPE